MDPAIFLVGHDLDCGSDDDPWCFSVYVLNKKLGSDLTVSVNYRSERVVEAYISESSSLKNTDLESVVGFISTTNIPYIGLNFHKSFDIKTIISELISWSKDFGAAIPDQEKCLNLVESVFYKVFFETLRRVYQISIIAGLSSSDILKLIQNCKLDKSLCTIDEMPKKFEVSLFELDDETLGLNHTGPTDYIDGSWKLSMRTSSLNPGGLNGPCPHVTVTFGRNGTNNGFSEQYPVLFRAGEEPTVSSTKVHSDLFDWAMPIKAPIPSMDVVATLLEKARMEALREYVRCACREVMLSGLSSQDCIDAASSVLCEEIMTS